MNQMVGLLGAQVARQWMRLHMHAHVGWSVAVLGLALWIGLYIYMGCCRRLRPLPAPMATKKLLPNPVY